MGIPKEAEIYTYEDYLTWPDEERWEIIHGVPYDMSPAPARKHQGIAIELATQIHNYLKGKPCKAYPAPFDVRLPDSRGSNDTVVQPDISIICDKNKLDEKGCAGAPDVIIEILSPSTASKDLKIKLALYEEFGVKEYWVVDPHDEVVFLFSLDEKGAYGKPRVFSPPDKIESAAIPGMLIELTPVFSE